MKELSIEEKAKRYDEAIKRVKSKIKNDKDHVLYEDDVIEIFPQTQESDDEKIRKEIINIFHSLADGKIPVPINFADIFAWLERQEGKHITEPQSRWRPSDEQMNALDLTLRYCQVSYSSFEHLNSLYDDLEKLKGE